MRILKLLISGILLLASSLVLGQVTVKISDMTEANGRPVSNNGPIQIVRGENLRLFFGVGLTRPANQAVDGTLRIYTKRNTFDNIGLEVPGGAQFIDDAIWNTAFSTSIAVTISSANFNNNGGILYAEFQSTSGIIYKSSDWSVQLIEDGAPPPPNSSPRIVLFSASYDLDGSFQSFYDDYRPFRDDNKIRIVKGDEIKVVLRYHIFFPSNYNCSNGGEIQLFARDGSGFRDGVAVPDAIAFIGGSARCAPDLFRTINATIKSDLFINNESGSLYAEYRDKEGVARSFNLLTELVPPITGNYIGNNQEVSEGARPAGLWGGVPRYSVPRGDVPIIGDFTFQWQKKVGGRSFIDIPGAKESGYQPDSLYETTSYRREVSSLGSFFLSNTVTVQVNTLDDSNIICCSQEAFLGEQPAPITGSESVMGSSYQWEEKGRGRSEWSSIVGATGKDYNPPIVYYSRGTTTKNFRRVFFPANGAPPLISNTTKVTYKRGNR